MRIVVCDDEPLARERLVRIVKESGHEVVAQAKTGIEAIIAVKSEQPDIIESGIKATATPSDTPMKLADIANNTASQINPKTIVIIRHIRLIKPI